MNIILEGPDGSGKSKLAEYLADYIGYAIVKLSNMQDVSTAEFQRVVDEHLTFNKKIFDRHRCVSEPIYGEMRNQVRITPEQIQAVYMNPRNLFIYSNLSFNHVLKDYDKPEHLNMIERNKILIRSRYADWAIKHAHIIYRGNPRMIARLVLAAEKEMS